MNKRKCKSITRWQTLIFMFALASLLVVFCSGGAAFAEGNTIIKAVPGQVTDCTLPVGVSIEGLPQGQALKGFNFIINYDPSLLEYQYNQDTTFQPGTFLPNWTWFEPAVDNTSGTIEISAAKLMGSNPTATAGTAITVTFKVKGNGTANIGFGTIQLVGPDNSNLSVTPQGAQVVLTGCGTTPPAQTIVKAVPGQVTDCTLPVGVSIEGLPQGQALKGFNFIINYDPSLLEYQYNQDTTFQPGTFLPNWTWFEPAVDNTSGTIEISAAKLMGSNPTATAGTAITVTFKVKGNGTANIGFGIIQLVDSNNGNLPVTPQGAQAVLAGCNPPVNPTVATSTATNITTTTAVLNGSIIANGGSVITDYGFYWGTEESNLTKQSVGNSNLSGSFSLSLNNLTPETKYYYKTYAINAVGTAYGDVKNFTTDKVPAPVPPTVQTGIASKTTTTAVLNGTIVTNNGSAITDYGFKWGTDQANLVSQSVGKNDLSGAFSLSLNNLTPETKYYYQAYATNAGGTTNGEVKEFTTDEIPAPVAPTVQTGSASKTTTTAVLNGTIVTNNGSAITDYGFKWGTDQANLASQSVGKNDLSGSFSLSLNNLTPETKYYYQAYATNAGGTTSGEVKEFTTDKVIVLPTVVTVTLDKDMGVSSERPLTISSVTNPATTVDWQVVVKDNNGVPVFTATPPAGIQFSGVVYQPGGFGGLPYAAEYTVVVTATPAGGEPVTVEKTFGVSNFNYFIHDITFSGSGSTLKAVVDLFKSGNSEPRMQAICQVTSSNGKVVFLNIGNPVELDADSDNTIECQLGSLQDGSYTVQIFLWLQDGTVWKILGEPKAVNFTIGEAV